METQLFIGKEERAHPQINLLPDLEGKNHQSQLKGFQMILDVTNGGTKKLNDGDVVDGFTGLVGPYSALPDNTEILCENGTATINYASNQGYAFKSVSASKRFKGLRFPKGGIFLEGNGCRDFTLDNLELKTTVNIANAKLCGVELSSVVQNGKITNCLFAGANGHLNIYSAHDCDGMFIANNEFIDTDGGIHWGVGDNAGTYGTIKNFLFEQNYFKGIKAQAVELQAKLKGASINVIIQDNWVEYHRLGPTYNDNTDAYSYSVPFEGGKGVIIRRNVSIQKKSNAEPDGVGVRIIYEIGGELVVCEDNYSDGGNHVVAANGAKGSGNDRNNKFLNYNQGPSNANQNTTVHTNNGPNVNNSIDLIARGRPHRNQRYGTITPIPPTDPCADVKAQLVQTTAQLAAALLQRDELQRRINKALPLSQQVTAALNGN